MTEIASTTAAFHIWSHHDKQLLCVLSRYLKTAATTDDASQLARESHRILQWIFAHGDAQSHNTPTMTAGGIRRMLFELHRRMHTAWKEVFLESSFSNPTRWSHQIQQLKAAARSLGLLLVDRKSEHPDARSRIRELEQSRQSRGTQSDLSRGREGDLSQTQEHVSRYNDASAAPMNYEISGIVDERNATRVPTSREQEVREFLMALRDFPRSTDWDSFSYGHLFNGSCRVGFRVGTLYSHSINTRDGCYAGLYTGSRLSQLPRSSYKYCEHAYLHLRGEKERSPILSITTCPTWAMQMFMRDENAILIFIDMDALFAQADSPSYITPVVPLLQRMPPFSASLAYLRTTDDAETRTSSRGTRWLQPSEWLVWSDIPGNCIINAIDHSGMKSFLRSDPEVDRRLLLSRIGRSGGGREVSALLRNANIKPSGVWAQAVGRFTHFLGLDFAHAYHLGKTIKHHWVEKHRAPPLRRPKRKARSHLVNLTFQGGFAEGFWQATTGKFTRKAPETEPNLRNVFEKVNLDEAETDNEGTSNPNSEEDDEAEPENSGINIVDLTGIESDAEDDEVVIMSSNALRRSVLGDMNLDPMIQTHEGNDMSSDGWTLIDNDDVDLQNQTSSGEGNNTFAAGCHRIEQMFI